MVIHDALREVGTVEPGLSLGKVLQGQAKGLEFSAIKPYFMEWGGAVKVAFFFFFFSFLSVK